MIGGGVPQGTALGIAVRSPRVLLSPEKGLLLYPSTFLLNPDSLDRRQQHLLSSQDCCVRVFIDFTAPAGTPLHPPTLLMLCWLRCASPCKGSHSHRGLRWAVLATQGCSGIKYPPVWLMRGCHGCAFPVGSSISMHCTAVFCIRSAGAPAVCCAQRAVVPVLFGLSGGISPKQRAILRKKWDSNPWYKKNLYVDLANQCLRPLSHFSAKRELIGGCLQKHSASHHRRSHRQGG